MSSQPEVLSKEKEDAKLILNYWCRTIIIKSISMEDIKNIIISYFYEIKWRFHEIPNCPCKISKDGLTVDYEKTDKYRPLYFGSTLASTGGSKKFIINIKFVKVSNINSIAFIEDPELNKPHFAEGIFTRISFIHNGDNKVPVIRYRGEHYNWRGNKENTNVKFNESGCILQIVMDLRKETAEIKNLANDKEVSILDGITEHTRIAILPLRTKICIDSYFFEN